MHFLKTNNKEKYLNKQIKINHPPLPQGEKGTWVNEAADKE
jgi:hypothetical protein